MTEMVSLASSQYNIIVFFLVFLSIRFNDPPDPAIHFTFNG